MPIFTLKVPKTARRTLAGALAGLFLVSAASAEDAVMQLAALDQLEQQTGQLQRQVDTLGGVLRAFAPMPPALVGEEAPRVRVAQSNADLASINVRLSQLEEQMRSLTGQIEGLQFQMTQLQTLMQRQQEDYEFRFQQLEGGSGGLGKTEAAPGSGGAMPSGGLPQSDIQPQGAGQLPAVPEPGDQGEIIVDPEAEGYILGEPESPLGTLSAEELEQGLDQPLDLSFDPGGGVVSDADADAQYRAGYEAVQRGDYAFAEEQFRQFIGLFPDHPQAPEATHWLGDALIQRGAYDEAADVLLSGFQSYPSAQRAPDMLMKLGIALAGAGEQDTACRTFQEVLKRYPNVSTTFRMRLEAEAESAQC